MKLKQTGKLAPKNKPWQLIRDAVNDLELQEKTPGIEIDMSTWHESDGNVCHQCLAGAVISRRLGADTAQITSPASFLAAHDRLWALNDFRNGDVSAALQRLGYQTYIAVRLQSIGGEDRPSSADVLSPRIVKLRMRELADILEANLTTKKTLRKIPKKIK